MKRVLPTLLLPLLLLVPTKVFAVVINEFLPSPSASSLEWVEFFNNDISNDVLKTYWVDDDADFVSDSGSSGRVQLGGLNTDNATYPYIELASFLNNSGDFVVLFDADGNVVDQHQYTSNPGTDASIGRGPDGGGSFNVFNKGLEGASVCVGNFLFI